MSNPKVLSSRTEALTLRNLLRSRLAALSLAVALIVVQRASGLVLPYSSKFLVDEAIGHRSRSALLVVLASVATATILQALVTYILTRTIAVSAQHVVADIRKRIYSHVVRLQIAFFDRHQSGAMVNRIMHDPEGVRQLVGGGLVDFAGR